MDPQAGPGTDFTELEDAIAAAAPGDTLLVKTGIFVGQGIFSVEPIDIDKPLTLTSDPNPCGHHPGDPGAETVLSSSTLTENAGALRRMNVTSPVRSGQMIDVQFEGAANELAFLFYSPDFDPIFSPLFQTSLVLALPATYLAVVQLDGAGQASLSSLANLPPGVEARTFYAQALFGPFGGATAEYDLGAPSALTVLESGL